MRWNSRQAKWLVAAATLAFGMAGCSAQDEPAPQSSAAGTAVEIGTGGEEVTIGLTYVPNVQFAPVYVAASDEIFRAAGIGAVIRHHGNDEGLFTALASGEEDVVVASGDEVLQGRAAGLDLVAIGAYYNQYPVAVISKEASPVSDLADLKGKSVGIPGEFGSSWFGLLAALDQVGLTTDDVDVVSIGYTQAASLASDQVDCIIGFVNSDAVQLEEMGEDIVVLPLADYDVPLVGATMVTTAAWMDAHPDLAVGVVGSIVAGMDRVIANPQHALEISALWDTSIEQGPARQTAAALLAGTIPLWERPGGAASGEQDLQTWEKMAPFLAGILDVPLEEMGEEEAVTNQFVTGKD